MHNLSIILGFEMLHLIRSTTKITKWHVRQANSQISLGIRAVWSVFALRFMGLAKKPKPSLDGQCSDQTGRTERTDQFAYLVVSRLTYIIYAAGSLRLFLSLITYIWTETRQNHEITCARRRLGYEPAQLDPSLLSASKAWVPFLHTERTAKNYDQTSHAG